MDRFVATMATTIVATVAATVATEIHGLLAIVAIGHKHSHVSDSLASCREQDTQELEVDIGNERLDCSSAHDVTEVVEAL